MEMPFKSVDIPKARMKTELTFIIYFSHLLGLKEFIAPKINIRGVVPRAKANIASAPFARVQVLIA